MGVKLGLSGYLREEYRLSAFEDRVLKRKHGSRRNEVVGNWRKLHNGELHNFQSSKTITTLKNKDR
jgi:hypothetical protein